MVWFRRKFIKNQSWQKVFKDAQNVDPSTLTTNEAIKAANKKIQDAYDALVLLVPTKLTISSDNDVYVRNEKQKELKFNVTFNDETRNLNNVVLLEASEINTYDVIAADNMIITEKAVKAIEEVLV